MKNKIMEYRSISFRRILDMIYYDRPSRVILVKGINKVGKTTMLKQLKEEFVDSVYVDCSEATSKAVIEDIINGNKYKYKYVFIDNVTCIPEFEHKIGDIKLIAEHDKDIKFVISSSSPLHINQIAENVFGGERCKIVNTTVLTFCEYLMLTGKIKSYNIDDILASYEPNIEDFKDYMQHKNLGNKQMGFVIDKDYLMEEVRIMNVASKNSVFTDSTIEDTDDVIESVSNILTYIFNKSYPEIKVKLKEEDDSGNTGSKLSENIKAYSKTELQRTISMHRSMSKEKTEVMSSAIDFLLYNHLVFVNLVESNDTNIRYSLNNFYSDYGKFISGTLDIREFIDLSNLTIVNPLIYGKLGSNIIDIDYSYEDEDETNFYKMNEDLITLKTIKNYIRGSYASRATSGVLNLCRLEDKDESGSSRELAIYDKENSMLLDMSLLLGEGDETYIFGYRWYEFYHSRIICTNNSDTVLKIDKTTGLIRVNYLMMCILIDLGLGRNLVRTDCNIYEVI